MFRPATLFIGLRYTRSKSRNQFISLISLISILGIALGVTVLITVLSVVNGFDREIKKQIFGMLPAITINSYDGKIPHWQALEPNIQSTPGVTSTAPFVSTQAILTNANATLPIMLIGIIPQSEKNVSDLIHKMVAGSLFQLKTNEFGIVIGKELAKKLQAALGDEITLTTVQGTFSMSHVTPEFKKFKIVGIFHAGGGALGFDERMAFIDLTDAQQLISFGSAISGFHVNIHNMYDAPAVSEALQTKLPSTLTIWNWTNQLGDFFENIRMTKTIMFFIFVLIITVAVFNLISTMVMVVKNKEMDIAILRTLGATPNMILIIFIIQGLLIGLGGTALGVLGGIGLSLSIPTLSIWLQNTLNINLISAKVYFVNYLPSALQWHDVCFIGGVALALSLAATLYPAWNASRTEPVEALNSGSC